MKKLIAFVLCAICINSTLCVFAFGKKDTEDKTPKNPESWTESFDISEKKSGKYNIVVTATDTGGNTSYAGPMNIFIDPDSDLPICGVTNPYENMAVPGNLNIVGTCIDDDAVASVELVFDNDTEHPVTAEGKDFWSYYLDTTHLDEGEHTISVTGIDVNGLRGKPCEVIWELNRRTPQQLIDSHPMGALVSGKQLLSGTVYDGNGISTLSYSLDGGKTYTPVKINFDKKTKISSFEFSMDTTKLPDGPTVIWLQAYDRLGTQGMYSFLFFVDNTAPNVQIAAPLPDTAVNGLFSVTGSARDVIGITALSWQYGEQGGNLDLIPGNPFWTFECDTRTQNIKNAELIITATDVAGNVTKFVRKQPINQDLDKAITNISTPAPGDVIENNLNVAGIATDDDGIAEIYYTVDTGAEVASIPSEGVFTLEIPAAELSAGNHSVTVWAKDIHGIEGKKTTVPFIAAGAKPLFNEAEIAIGTAKSPYVPCMELHPEAGAVITTAVTSPCGIKSLTWHFAGKETEETPLKKPVTGTTPLKITVPVDRWGYTDIVITATDIHDRVSKQYLQFYLTNLGIAGGDRGVFFLDSTRKTTDENGSTATVTLNKDQPVTLFFNGGNAKSVRFVPDTNLASVSLNGNAIIIEQKNTQGKSKNLHVEVTTDRGIKYSSPDFVIISPAQDAPSLTIDGSPVLNGFEDITVRGTAKSALEITSLTYRILSSDAKGKPTATEWQPIEDFQRGNFSISLAQGTFANGISVVEIMATDETGSTNSTACFVRTLPPPAAKIAKPTVTYFEGEDVYYTVAYQGTHSVVEVKAAGEALDIALNPEGGIIPRESLGVNGTIIETSIQTEDGKIAVVKYTGKRQGTLSASFLRVNDTPYMSGMNVAVATGKNASAKLFCKIISDYPVSQASYTINDTQTGKATVRKTDDPRVFEAEIPLAGLPVQLTPIRLSCETGKTPTVVETGYINVVRPAESAATVEDKEQLYWQTAADGKYVDVSAEGSVVGYGNYKEPFTAEFTTASKDARNAFSLLVEGNAVILKPTAEGTFDNIELVITDAEGIRHNTVPVSVRSDYSEPKIAITTPQSGAWIKDSLAVNITVTEAQRIKTVEYAVTSPTPAVPQESESTDLPPESITWKEFAAQKKTSGDIVYQQTISLKNLADGEIELHIRATDTSGKITTITRAVHKDTLPPEVAVIVPEAGVSVNGETLLVMEVKDQGKLVRSAYITQKSKSETEQEIQNGTVTSTLTGTTAQPLLQNMNIRFTDAAGNSNNKTSWDFIVDAKSDIPVAEIHVPQENEVIQKDFIISGVVYDDDGDCSIQYKIDNGQFITLEKRGTSFSIPVPLLSLTDNEHKVTVVAEDLHGIRSVEAVRRFRISLEEPKAEVFAPKVGETVKDMVTISGVASDKNGISRVEVSLDNGNSYVPAKGTEKWKFTFNSHVIQDGTHVAFIRVYDGYEITGLYSTLLNIDNTPPVLSLDLPRDDSRTSGMVFFSGQATDNVGLEKLYCKIRSLNGNAPVKEENLEIADIIARGIDISRLPDGFYNVEITGEDAGGNISRVSRNIELGKSFDDAKIEILYPMDKERMNGNFNLYGKIQSEKPVSAISLYIDDKESMSTTLSSTGYYRFAITPEIMTEGLHKISVRTVVDGKKLVASPDHFIDYKTSGAWVTVDNFIMGDFSFKRAYLKGTAGYTLSAEDAALLEDKETPDEVRDAIESKKLARIELSFDNGKTFQEIGTDNEWEYRIEDSYMREGYHFMILRATMENREKALSRFIVQIDKTAPVIKLISPGEGGRYNQMLEFSGLASDDVNLDQVTLALRTGDKSSYEVPGFIQGLYFDFHVLGSTLFDIGAGLTFFDDNVKLQVQYGQMTDDQYAWVSDKPKRYGGNAFGAKLLANIFYLPFSYFAGPDWTWLSASFALGADFTLFSETQSGAAQMVTAVLAQLEFPRVTIPNMKRFRTYSFYTEFQLWFAPSDRDAEAIQIPTFIPQLSFGLRSYVF